MLWTLWQSASCNVTHILHSNFKGTCYHHIMVAVTRQARHQACHEITRTDALLQLADRLVAAKEPDLEKQAEDQATKQALETWENELRDWLNDDLAKYVEDHGVPRGTDFII